MREIVERLRQDGDDRKYLHAVGKTGHRTTPLFVTRIFELRRFLILCVRRRLRDFMEG
jgi:hypothetical protein